MVAKFQSVRAYAKYERQIGGTFSQSYVEDTFARYPNLAELLIKLFSVYVSTPSIKAQRDKVIS